MVSICVGLIVACGAKLLSSFLELPIQNSKDPLFGLPMRTMWRLGCLLDFGILLTLWKVKKTRHCVITWIGALFLAYHLAIKNMGLPAPCPCLGDALIWTGLSEDQLSAIAFIFAAYMFFAGLSLWWQRRTYVPNSTAI